MTESQKIKQQQAQRILELFAIARQRYLDAGGDPHGIPSGRKGEDYLTDEERQEALALGRQVFDSEYIQGFLSQFRPSISTSSEING